MALSRSLLCLFSLSFFVLFNSAYSRNPLKSNASAENFGPWGSETSDNAINWQFTLAEGETIKKVVIRHYDIVDSIAFTVIDANGYITTKEYGNPLSTANQITLADEEYITQISGSYGNYKWNDYRSTICKIKIHTNTNVNGYGSYGTCTDVSDVQTFESSTVDGIVGSYGTIGSNKYFLESIGISASSTSDE